MDKADLIQECPSCGQQGWVMPDMKPQLRHEHDCPHKPKERKMTDAVRYRLLAKAGWIDDTIMEYYGIKDCDKDSLDAAIDRILSTAAKEEK